MALMKCKTTGTGGKSRWSKRAFVKVAARRHRRVEDNRYARGRDSHPVYGPN